MAGIELRRGGDEPGTPALHHGRSRGGVFGREGAGDYHPELQSGQDLPDRGEPGRYGAAARAHARVTAPFHQGSTLSLQGDLGPFNPGLPVDVPLWLAINLKQRQKCRLLPPEWMDVGEHSWVPVGGLVPELRSQVPGLPISVVVPVACWCIVCVILLVPIWILDFFF